MVVRLCGISLLVLSTLSPLSAAPPLADTTATDRLIFTGATAPGTTSLTFANNVYTFTFQGDEPIAYQIDLNDPLVAAGTIRIHELSSDSWPIDGGGFVFRLPTSGYYFPTNYQNKTTLTSHTVSGKTLTLEYLMNYNGAHAVRYEFTQEGKALRIRAYDPIKSLAVPNNFAGMTYGAMKGVETPVKIQMQGTLAVPTFMFRRAVAGGNKHYFTANFTDMFNCNGADYGFPTVDNPIIGTDSVQSALYTYPSYKSLSNGQLPAPFDDTLLIVVSSRIKDVLITTTAPITPYRHLLANRMVFNGPEKVWSWYSGMFDLYASLGMDNLAGYFFDWSTSIKDPPGPLNAGPDWAPALNQTEFTALLQKGRAYGALVAAYTNFNSLPPTAPSAVSNPSQIARDSAGNPKLYIGPNFPLLAVEASAPHASYESQQLRNKGSNAAYLDIHTYGSISKGPDGDHLDQVASSPWAKTMRTGFIGQKKWFETMRTIMEGPLTGEGSIANKNSNMEFLWYGYVDSVQRTINTGALPAASLPAGSPFTPTNWPIIPEYEWRVAAKVQINHGNGFYDRFFNKGDGATIVNQSNGLAYTPLTQDAMDLYQAFLITYGHAGYVVTNGMQSETQGYVTHPAAAQTYFMTNALQTYYFATPILSIRYLFEGSFQTFENVLFKTETLDTFRHIPIALEFENGLRLFVNHSVSSSMSIVDAGQTYILPPRTGWYASTPGPYGMQCFSAIPSTTGGKRIDYCRAPSQYEYFNGRGQVTGYGNISTTSRRSKWNVFSSNLTVTEDAEGNLQSNFGPAPTLTSVQIFPNTYTIEKGKRIGVKAVAFFSNGGARDITTLLGWASTKPFVASVNDAGVIEGLNKGQAYIVGILPTGGIITTPMVVTIP